MAQADMILGFHLIKNNDFFCFHGILLSWLTNSWCFWYVNMYSIRAQAVKYCLDAEAEKCKDITQISGKKSKNYLKNWR